MRNCKDIIKTWLRQHGYDGLSTNECGCGFDDFVPCMGDNFADCVPSHKTRGMCDGNPNVVIYVPGKRRVLR